MGPNTSHESLPWLNLLPHAACDRELLQQACAQTGAILVRKWGIHLGSSLYTQATHFRLVEDYAATDVRRTVSWTLFSQGILCLLISPVVSGTLFLFERVLRALCMNLPIQAHTLSVRHRVNLQGLDNFCFCLTLWGGLRLNV